MDAISLLMQEHQLILRALDALEAFAGELAGSTARPEDPAELARFVRFIREFADARHHGKEEDILFDAMVSAGFPRGAGPVGVMLAEHDAGRRYVAAMAARVEQAAPWTEADRAAVVEAARGYASLLRSHIAKEDRILYPMARQHLGEELLGHVDRACAAYEERHAGGAALEALAGELASRHAAAA